MMDRNELMQLDLPKTTFFMYSEDCPQGNIFECLQEHKVQVVSELEKAGWVDTYAYLKNKLDDMEAAQVKVNRVPKFILPGEANAQDVDEDVVEEETETVEEEESVNTADHDGVSTDDVKSYVKQLLDSGKTEKEIRVMTGLHHSTVKKYIKEVS